MLVRLRVPGWAPDATLSVNGAARPRRPEPGTYAEIRRVWSAGDVVELTLPMPARLMQAHPLVEEARNQVAVQRGPLVYCLESTDLPDGVRVQDVVIPRGIALKPRFDPDLLGGVTVLEGRAEARREPGWSGAALPRAARRARRTADRPAAHPLFRLGQPRPVGDVGLALPGIRLMCAPSLDPMTPRAEVIDAWGMTVTPARYGSEVWA